MNKQEDKILPAPTAENGFAVLPQCEVSFLLGTDVHIGEPETCEQRVAITPDQAGQLRDWLADLGIKLNLMVVNDAGARAGFPDADYQAVGGVIVEESELPSLKAPDLVHALKESTHYEATIPGPFLRIGALHSGDFRPDCGLAEVLIKSDCCGVFDGSAVGGYAYNTDFHVKPKFRIPLRSSMSVYAGKLAGEDVGDHLEHNEKVVVSGGGVVGTSAVGVLLERHLDQLKEVLIIEKFESRCRELEEMYRDYPVVKIKQGFDISADDIKDAKGLVLTIFIQGSAETPKVVDLERLKGMKQGGYVVDVAIDEGGGVATSRDGMINPKTGKFFQVTVEDIRSEVQNLPNDLTYQADNHMPRRRPHEASIEHGNTGLMYLATLLYLAAGQGGPKEVIKYIMDQDNLEEPANIKDALVLDLRNGMAFIKLNDITVLYRHVLKKSDYIQDILTKAGCLNTFA